MDIIISVREYCSMFEKFPSFLRRFSLVYQTEGNEKKKIWAPSDIISLYGGEDVYAKVITNKGCFKKLPQFER